MDFNLNNNVNATKVLTQPQFKYNAPPEKEEPVAKKKTENPALNNLSSLIATAQTEKKKPADEVKEKLQGIGSELDDIEAYVNEINSQGEITVEESGKILNILKGLQARLDALEKEIQELASKYKLDDKEAEKQMGQMSQISLLNQLIEKQREQQKQNAPKVEETVKPAQVQTVQGPQAV